jgi:predicted enzyme related to lactoylglutathione lyase
MSGTRCKMSRMDAFAMVDIAIFDAPDIERAGRFYAELAGWEVVRQAEDRFGVRAPNGQEVEFQLAPDHVAPEWPGSERPQQFHLDLRTADLEGDADRAVKLGATRLADGPSWITLADPAGHPFDLCRVEDHASPMPLFAVTIDAPDAAGLARFYATMTGWEQVYDGPEGAMLSHEGRNLMFQKVEQLARPTWPDPAQPQQAHIDFFVRDLDDGEAKALELGATRLDGGGEHFRVFADPAGHPFCLIDA